MNTSFFLFFSLTIFIIEEGKCLEVDDDNQDFSEATPELVICVSCFYLHYNYLFIYFLYIITNFFFNFAIYVSKINGNEALFQSFFLS